MDDDDNDERSIDEGQGGSPENITRLITNRVRTYLWNYTDGQKKTQANELNPWGLLSIHVPIQKCSCTSNYAGVPN